MKIAICVLFGIALLLWFLGFRVSHGPGSADERVGGAIFYMIAGIFAIAGFILTLAKAIFL